MDKDKGFTVRDKRTGSSDAGADATPKQQESGPRKSPEPQRPDSAGDGRLAQEMDFATFVISLASTAQMSLGAVPHPETNQTAVNLPAAKQMIDILALLQEKTKGNLSEQEAALLEQVLFNLRIHYVRTAEGQKKSGG